MKNWNSINETAARRAKEKFPSFLLAREKMREKGQTEVAKTLETPVFSRGIEILTEKIRFCDRALTAGQHKNTEEAAAARFYRR